MKSWIWDYVQGHGVDMDFEYALTNSLAFGGHNGKFTD